MDTMGFSEVSRIYVEDAGSIRKLCEILFEPRSEGEQVGVAPLYAWLKKNRYEDMWKLTLKLRADMLKEAEVVMPDGFDWHKWAFDAQMGSAFARAKRRPES